ncbi:hypothetical protein ACP4OV_005650 [Aristida adscensionis]
MDSSAATDTSALTPPAAAAQSDKVAAGSGGGAGGVVSSDDIVFTVTDGDEVAEVLGGRGGAPRVLPGEGFAAADAVVDADGDGDGDGGSAKYYCKEMDMTFAVTEGNEVAEVLADGELRVLPSDSFADDDVAAGGATEAAATTTHHFVDVQGEREAALLLVSVREDQRRIVAIQRFSSSLQEEEQGDGINEPCHEQCPNGRSDAPPHSPDRTECSVPRKKQRPNPAVL